MSPSVISVSDSDRKSSEIIGTDKDTSKPKSFAIYRRPPVSIPGEAVIGFVLPRACAVALDLLVASGRKIATLTEGWHEAGGYEVGTDGLTSGLYLWRFRAGDYYEGKYIILVT